MFEFLRLVWVGITEAMRLNPRAFEIVAATPAANGVVLAIAIIGGASLLLGQSVILFVNRVSPGRFLLSLLINGIVFTLSLLIWALAIWITGQLIFGDRIREAISFGTVARLVGLGAAPYAFGFLVLLPYAGTFVGRILSVWSLLVVLAGLTVLAGGDFWAALICTVIGWLVITMISATIGRPIIYARNWLWKRLTGADMDASVQDILTQFAASDSAAGRRGGKP